MSTNAPHESAGGASTIAPDAGDQDNTVLEFVGEMSLQKHVDDTALARALAHAVDDSGVQRTVVKPTGKTSSRSGRAQDSSQDYESFDGVVVKGHGARYGDIDHV